MLKKPKQRPRGGLRSSAAASPAPGNCSRAKKGDATQNPARDLGLLRSPEEIPALQPSAAPAQQRPGCRGGRGLRTAAAFPLPGASRPSSTRSALTPSAAREGAGEAKAAQIRYI